MESLGSGEGLGVLGGWVSVGFGGDLLWAWV